MAGTKGKKGKSKSTKKKSDKRGHDGRSSKKSGGGKTGHGRHHGHGSSHGSKKDASGSSRDKSREATPQEAEPEKKIDLEIHAEMGLLQEAQEGKQPIAILRMLSNYYFKASTTHLITKGNYDISEQGKRLRVLLAKNTEKRRPLSCEISWKG